MSKPIVSTQLLFAILLVVVAAVVLLRLQGWPTERLPAPLPSVKVEGWTNTTAPPTAEDLSGKWVVVDCWATWCGPCIATLPALADFRQRWPEDQLVVIGITPEPSSSLPNIEQVVDSVEGFSWPVAYGGQAYLSKYRVDGIPALMLYDPTGRLVVDKSHNLAEIEAAMHAATR